MSRAAFSSFARNIGRLQSLRYMAQKSATPMFMGLKTNSASMKMLFPELVVKNQRMSQIAKLATRSRRLCCLQLQRLQIGALSLLLTSTGEILIDFQDMINSLKEEDDEELLRRTSLLVQTRRQG